MGTENQAAVGEQPPGTDGVTESPDEPPAGSTEGSSNGESPELQLDTLLEVAQNRRRRRILQYLDAGDGAVEVGELAEHLAALEYDCPDAGPTSTQRKRMYVGIYQGHLPKMDEMGVVEFDKDRGEVEPGPHAQQVTRFVERATGNAPPWPRFYLGLATLAVGLFVVPFVWPAGTHVANLALAVVLSLLVITAGGHLYWTREGPL